MIGIDIMGPLPKTNKGNRYVILITDYATGFVEGRAIKNKTAENVKKFLLEVFTRHGPPQEIRTDCGLEFNNEVIKALTREWGIRMRLTAPYSPWSNGKAERTNQTIIAKLAKIIVNEKDWDDMLSIAIYHY
ncbi:POL [Hepatospora eriocheir]|uniref:POL n=1 Tax=Hepatospora eriocheir TaxID=1081669 RepID=A0A1X0Q9T5_9MICR|nr:POL [Hepatospora eriocheir]